MADYLAEIPVHEPERKEVARASSEVMARGGKIYEQQCASCHGDQGQGVPSMYPALAGNRDVMLGSPNNLVQIIRKGGFAPATQGNPLPFGMPPFNQILSREDVAAVTTYVRQSWGNSASPVSAFDVERVR